MGGKMDRKYLRIDGRGAFQSEENGFPKGKDGS